MSSFLTPIVKALSQAVAPLEISFSSKEELEAFLFKYGWDYQVDSGQVDAVNTAFAVVPLFDVIFNSLDELINGNTEEQFTATIEVMEATKDLVSHISDLGPGGIAGLPSPFDQSVFWSELSEALFPELLATYLKSYQPAIYGLLHITGVIQYQQQTPAGQDRINYVKTVVDWSQLGTALVNPYEAINQRFKWNVSGESFKHEELLRVAENCFHAMGVPVSVGVPRQELSALVHDNQLNSGINELEIPIVDGVSPADRSYWKIGSVLLPIADPAGSDNAPSGLAISPILQGELSTQIYFSQDIYLQLRGAFDADNDITVKLYPDSIDIDTDLGDSVIEAWMELIGAPEDPWLLLGDREGSRLELEGFYAAYGLRGQISDLENIIKIGTSSTEESPMKKLRLAIKLSDDGDGFINNVTGGDDITADFAGTMTWSSKTGFAFEGSAGLELAIPLHLELGPVEISTLYASLGVSNADDDEFVKADFGVAITADFGPLVAVVDNIGVRAKLTPLDAPGQAGALGNADFDFGFKPPNGVGLSIDAGAVSGGGYLYFDFDKEEYAGVLELDLSGIVSVTAVGLITTRMPDGSKGFSLLLIITAEFGSPIQLGFGFTLSGVGGLLGLNRTMRLEEIAKGIRDGGINSIMFPQNVVENAPKIISDLKNYFPVEEGTFLIGPMVKIGWGTPNLITVSLGVIIEIPGNIAILGVLKVALPDEDAGLIVIQVNFMGAIEFDKERLWFFASLYESRVLFITLEGDMGLLVGWGDNANFVVSVGGFHPAFNPPVLPFGEVRRISVSILNTDYARIIIQGYFAVTSNSVQFGASVELYFGVSAFNIDGHLAFDALFRFSPFYFIISISASLSVKVFGVGLFSVRMRGSLEGPSDWYVEGEGSISLLFFDISVDFSHTWGQEEDTLLPPVAVMPILEAEYLKLENWRAVLSDNSQLSVTLRSFEQTTSELILHPVGSLQVSQRAVPLGVTIDKLGNQAPNDVNHFEVSVETVGISQQGEIDESFARGQFFEQSDNQLLDAPSFEPMQGGVELSVEGETRHAPQAVKRVVRYEKIILDTHYKSFISRFYSIIGSLFGIFLKGNAMSLSPVSWQTKKQMQPFADKINVASSSYGVANVADNTAFASNTINFTSYTAAQEYLKSQTARDPNLKEQLHVIPSVELQDAA
jgi:hypothetical protein